MANRFAGRVAVVTGGVSGIGAGIGARLASEGARVSLWDRDADALANTHADHKLAVDVTDTTAVQRAADETVSALGKIDILIACAGITGPNASVWDYPVADWDRVIDVNLNGVFYCNRAVVPHMLRNGYGRIVNIASIAGKEGNPNAAAYSASKAGVIGLTKSLGKELSPAPTFASTASRRPPCARRCSRRCRSSTSTSCCRKSRWDGSARSMKSPRWSAGLPARNAASLLAPPSISPAAAPPTEAGNHVWTPRRSPSRPPRSSPR